MPAVKPRLPDKKHSFRQEVQIADKNYRNNIVPSYEFNDGKKVFIDKVNKDGYTS